MDGTRATVTIPHAEDIKELFRDCFNEVICWFNPHSEIFTRRSDEGCPGFDEPNTSTMLDNALNTGATRPAPFEMQQVSTRRMNERPAATRRTVSPEHRKLQGPRNCSALSQSSKWAEDNLTRVPAQLIIALGGEAETVKFLSILQELVPRGANPLAPHDYKGCIETKHLTVSINSRCTVNLARFIAVCADTSSNVDATITAVRPLTFVDDPALGAPAKLWRRCNNTRCIRANHVRIEAIGRDDTTTASSTL